MRTAQDIALARRQPFEWGRVPAGPGIAVP
jgi:hypothetical protein